MSEPVKLFTLSQIAQFISVMPQNSETLTITYTPPERGGQPFAMLTFSTGDGVLVEAHSQTMSYTWVVNRKEFEAIYAESANDSIIGSGGLGYLILELSNGRKFQFGNPQVVEPAISKKRKIKELHATQDELSTRVRPELEPTIDNSARTKQRIGQALAISAKVYGGTPKLEYFHNLGTPKITIRLSAHTTVTYQIGVSDVWERSVNNGIHSSRKLAPLNGQDYDMVVYIAEDLWNNQNHKPN